MAFLSLYSDEFHFFDEEEVRMLDEVVRDISFTLEIFEKEELRKKAEKGIRIEKLFSELIINMLPGVFYMYDEQLQFLRWNNRFVEVSGYSHDEFAEITTRSGFFPWEPAGTDPKEDGRGLRHGPLRCQRS